MSAHHDDDEGEARSREIPVRDEVLDRRAGSLFDFAVGAEDGDPSVAAAREEVFAELRALVATGLTDRQRWIVERYFTDGRTQAEIAEELGISQQVVSRQLFGVVREGKRVGGAIRRLRVLCEQQGIDPARWV
jgi:RNA polymerase sigma factor (sigma-70 family)